MYDVSEEVILGAKVAAKYIEQNEANHDDCTRGISTHQVSIEVNIAINDVTFRLRKGYDGEQGSR